MLVRKLLLRLKMPEHHITADRAWTLIKDKSGLNPTELRHIQSCDSCNQFLATFLTLARAAGFHVTLEVPEQQPGDDDSKKSA